MTIELKVYFNFRSPYCYLASKRMFDVIGGPDVELIWRPLGGWNGRSAPERAAYKVPIVRQDVARWARRMNIAYVVPPMHTDPTRAALLSYVAEKKGLLQPYITEVMHEEWGCGGDIGNVEVLASAAERAGLSRAEVAQGLEDAHNARQLAASEVDAQKDGAFGVPTFVVGKDIFWGNDRLDFLSEHLTSLRSQP